MSSETAAIRVKNICKYFQIYDRPQDRLKQSIWRHKRYYRDFKALEDVSFEVKKGETVGIIGRNGSGKSTLLQIICGTVVPTKGTLETNGRIAALLELGSGFNPEFTGRENVYLNASILGLSQEEIDWRFDDITKFADIGEFVDQPVKTYSSGMMVRLAFSVAINVDPEILIVDEALSVGDELFQRKCFSRIESIKNNGATILFVSHSGASIIELCDRAVLIDAGEKLAIGNPKNIVGQYQKLLYAPAEKYTDIRAEILASQDMDPEPVNPRKADDSLLPGEEMRERYDPHLRPKSTVEYESYGVYIESPEISTLSGEQVNNLVRNRTYHYSYSVRFDRGANQVRFGMMIKTIAGLELGGAVTSPGTSESISSVSAGSRIHVEFLFSCTLNPGVYFLNAGVLGDINGSEGFLHRFLDIETFRVIDEPGSYVTGVVDFGCKHKLSLFEAE